MGGVELIALTALIAMLPAGVQSDGGPWSQPATLSACSASGGPSILFPSDAPRHATGPGAIVWSSAPRCPGGAGPRISAIAPGGDAPGRPEIPRTASGRALALTGPIAAAAAPHGRMLLAGQAAAGARTQNGLLLSEGSARGPFSAPQSTGGPPAPLALSTAYLGDVALLSPSDSGHGPSTIELRVHRYYQSSFLAPVPVTSSRSVGGLALALDYRSDALAVWQRGEAIYARDMPGSNRAARSPMRIARAAPHARIAALRSDDNRVIIAWSETRGGITRVYAELSSPDVRFGAPRLLERFTDPGGLEPPPPRLARLLSESVMLAWTGAESGHWVVRTAAVDLNGVRSIDTISAPGRNALLASLAPGPNGEAYALWSEPQPSSSSSSTSAASVASAATSSTSSSSSSSTTTTTTGLDLSDQAVYAARGVDAYPGRTIFTAPQQISAPGASGSTSEAAIAVDPDSDRAIAAWRTPDGAIDYSLRALGGS